MGNLQQRVVCEYYYAVVKEEFDENFLKEEWRKIIRTDSFKSIIASSVFRLRSLLILYIEKSDNEFSVEKEFYFLKNKLQKLHAISGSFYWKKIPEIFRYVPADVPACWIRTDKYVPKCFFGILKEDKISEYVYYHFQLKEEGKTERIMHSSIGLMDRYLFMYDEYPRRYTDKPFRGRLKSNNTPDNWLEVMTPLFEKLNGRLWSEMPLLVYYYK